MSDNEQKEKNLRERIAELELEVETTKGATKALTARHEEEKAQLRARIKQLEHDYSKCIANSKAVPKPEPIVGAVTVVAKPSTSNDEE